MESVLQGISQVSVYLDNILITGQTEAEHLKRLDEVLARLVESGLHLNRNKSIFMDMSSRSATYEEFSSYVRLVAKAG